MKHDRRLQWLLDLPKEDRFLALRALSEVEHRELAHHWRLWARPEQVAPEGEWRTWLVMAGRGFGKTRLGAEWVREVAASQPDARIALIGASLAEVRAVMIEGESGLLAVCPPHRRPRFEPSLRRITWPNGAQATLYSAAEPDGLRGPQHSHVWCDEIAKWDNCGQRAEMTWGNMLLGLRLGECPQVLATTTPRAVPLLVRLLEEEGTIITRGRTVDNAANLPRRFMTDIRRGLRGSQMARQELDGELIADREGALWTRALLEKQREMLASSDPVRTVVAVDPPASSGGDACGIVVAALGEDGIARVLADCTVLRPTPERWARAVADAAQIWNADRVIAEANQGGSMVESVLRAADVGLPLRLVHARQGKAIRAEPVAALYEAGRVRHVGYYPELEDQLCDFVAGGKWRGGSHSPDRADAAVWALTELMLQRRASPRVRTDF